MDRGFTVEGLTVTYMPRGPGTGQADTLQQRARFFGYKRPYLGYCRIYLEQDALVAFEEYVAHEEDMRRQLQAVRDAGTPLSEWKRAFILSPALQPCRANVVQYNYARGRYSNDWYMPRGALAPADILRDNRSVVQRFLGTLTLRPDAGSDDRELAQRHEMAADVPLRRALEELLIPYRLIDANDSQERTGLLLQLSRALEGVPGELCTIYRMSPAYKRERGVDANGRLKYLFQGAFPVSPLSRRGSIYPGDKEIHAADRVSIQVHWLALTEGDAVVANEVPVLAVWVPARLGVDWLVQEQPPLAHA